MSKSEFLFVEKYRPQTIEDCILPNSIKNTLLEYVNRKEIPNLLFIGGAGVGKTSAAKALCNDVGCDYLFINASDENGIDTLRVKITQYASSISLSGGRKVIILDEFDAASRQFQDAFRSFLEQYSSNCTFILTCNYANKVITPIHSRCSVINFSLDKNDKKELIPKFFKRVCSILSEENIEYNKESVAAFINKYYPDNRRIINELQRYSIGGSIDVGILSQIGDIQLKDLITSLKNKDFSGCREWVVSNIDNDIDAIFRKIYDGMYTFVKPTAIPQLVLHIAKYQYQTSFVADKEIQLMSFLVEVICDVEFL